MARKVAAQLLIEGENKTKGMFSEINKSLESMNEKFAAASSALAGAFSVGALTTAVTGIAAAADSYNLMNARLKLATESQDEFNTAQTELRKIAIATQTPLASLTTLYGRISRPLKEAGRSQEDILKVTEAVATAFRVSGASAQEAENGVIQFAQALGSGALRGDEFNSVAEQAPRLMQALADSLGVPTGALKDMAAQGKLTASVVTDALTGQLAVLRKEAESLPETVGGAMTALADRWNEAIGQADVQPLIDALNQLGGTISDPSTRESLVLLASALTQVASAAIKAGAGTVSLAQDLGYIAARVSGNLLEIDRAAKELEKFEAAANGFGMLDIYMSDEEIAKGLAVWRAYYAALTKEQHGMNAETKKLTELSAKVQEDTRTREEAERAKHVGTLKSLQDQQLADAKAFTKSLVSEERKAAADIDQAKKAQIETQKRYSDALAALGAGVAGDPSFGQAQSLRLAAQTALSGGDIQGAKSNAQAALKMLQELEAAGENTYGFQGFIKSLQVIEQQADQINVDKANASFALAEQKTERLKKLIEDLSAAPISVKMDEVALAKVRVQLADLADLIGKPVDIAGTRIGASPMSLTNSALGAGIEPIPVEIKPVGVAQITRGDLPPVEVSPKWVRDGNSFSSEALEVSAKPRWVRDGNSFTDAPPVDVSVVVDQEAATSAKDQVAKIASDMQRKLQLQVMISAGDVAFEATGQERQKFATGGPVRGPGTGTSDSIPALLSNGEYVIRAAAVRKLGKGYLDLINNGIPLRRFADGGMVESVASMPIGPSFPDLGSLSINMGGENVNVYASPGEALNLQRLARKFGRT